MCVCVCVVAVAVFGGCYNGTIVLKLTYVPPNLGFKENSAKRAVLLIATEVSLEVRVHIKRFYKICCFLKINV